MLRINNLSKIYQRSNNTSVHALDRVSLTMGAGEFVAVQGPSGCGKTTLLLVTGGLLLPSEGSVKIDSRNLYSMSPDERSGLRARDIGFVFQQFHLISYLNVLDNVMTPSLPLPDRQAVERARELIDHFKLTERIGHFPAELSTGERQRVGLARALLNRPKLLLADEPTGNLDPENADTVLGYLAEFARSGGAVLMVTHSHSAASYAHRTVFLQAGRLLDAL
jgi:putative ABC transport system ATP-binding protein